MKRISFVLLLTLAGCSTYVYHTQLIKAPPETTPRIFLERDDSELFTVQFPQTTEIVQIKRYNALFRGKQWVSLDADSNIIAYLSKPETLGIGEIRQFEGKQLCIVFPEESLNSKEYDSTYLATYAKAEWCGYVNQIKKAGFSPNYP